MRSAGGRLFSKKQNGHWSEEDRDNVDGKGGDGFILLGIFIVLMCNGIVGGFFARAKTCW